MKHNETELHAEVAKWREEAVRLHEECMGLRHQLTVRDMEIARLKEALND